MIPPLFKLCESSDAVKAVLGTGHPDNPIRVYAFGDAGDEIMQPYVTWQTIAGQPNHYLGDLPNRDHFSLQIDVWGADPDSVTAAAIAMRDVIEPVGYITAHRGQSRDVITRHYRISFDAYLSVDR